MGSYIRFVYCLYMEFGSLHTHSHFSFLDGASSPEHLAHQAARLGHTAIVVTDIMGVYGAVRLQRACRDVGIRPIIGADIQWQTGTISIICQNERGYHQLCMLLTDLHHGSTTDDALDTHTLDDCYAIVHSSSADELLIRRICSQINASQIYIGIEHDARPWALHRARKSVALAESMALPYVIAQDVRYACSDDYAAYDLMVCIREGITIHDPHPLRPVNDKQCLRSEQEIRTLLPFEAGYRNLDRILSTCSFDILPETITPPSARIPEGRTSSEVLRELAHKGYNWRYQSSNPDLQKRAADQLEHELQVLEELELSDFFLVVHEVISESQRRGIRCSGRGSAANSIVAYVLGITGVCPIQHHLLFERFLHKGRKGTPDIDVDFDSDRRSEILAWMEERFGIEQTAMTATLITYRLRMAVRDAAKALGWPMETVSKLSKSVPSWSNHDIEHYRSELTSVVGCIPMLNILIRAVSLLIEHPRHLGQHSGGMVLSSKPLTMLTPLQRSANGVAIVQFDKDDIEAMGLVKFDVLGLRMLACISESVELIKMHHGHNVDIDDLALDDESTFSLIRSGKTLGIFQIESQGQMHLLAKHQPECFDDLITEVALFRPGPLQGGMVHPYIARRTGKSPIEYVHPDLEPLLQDTLGIVLFQEQVLEIAHRFAGMPLDQADDFRSLVSKNRDRVLMASMRDVFIQGAISRGVDLASAEQVYEIVSHFVGYGFCRSHAAAFAKIVYQSAWLKTHYPAAYMAAFMQHRPGMYNLMTIEEEARRFHVEIRLPDIIHSHVRYGLEQSSHGTWAIRKPLTSIRDVSEPIARQIILERAKLPFTSVEDFVCRLPSIPRDVLESIALSGALSVLEPDERKAMWIIGVVRQRQQTSVTMNLFPESFIHEHEIPELPEIRAQERLAYDYVTHGSARVHPMTLFRRIMNSMEIRSIETVHRMSIERPAIITTAGIVMLRQAPPTARGMLFITIEDETGFLQCVVPPQVRQKYKQELRASALMLKGKVTGIGQWRSIIVHEATILNNIIGGYHGHLSYAGGRDTLEVGQVVNFA